MKLYKETPKNLKERCKRYLKNNPNGTPRHFRAVFLKVSKSDIQYLKVKKPKLYQAVREAEDIILAHMEQKLMYSVDNKLNPVGIIFILRSYDQEQYAQDIKKYDDLINRTPYTLNFQNNSNNKLILPNKKISKGAKND